MKKQQIQTTTTVMTIAMKTTKKTVMLIAVKMIVMTTIMMMFLIVDFQMEVMTTTKMLDNKMKMKNTQTPNSEMATKHMMRNYKDMAEMTL